MSPEHRLLSPLVWSPLVSTFGRRRALRGKEAAAAVNLKPSPMAVFYPEDPSEISIVIETARVAKAPIICLGSGSRITPDLLARLPKQGYAVINLSGLSGVEELNSDSLWMSVLAGTPMKAVVAAARKHDLRLAGTDAEEGTVGGWLSASAGIDDCILGVHQSPILSIEAVLATGNLVHSVCAPRAATGPDPFSLLLGTWGGFGVITRATLKLEPLPERKLIAGFSFSSLNKAIDFTKIIVSRFLPPRRATLFIDGQASKRKARVVVAYEGQQQINRAGQKFAFSQAEIFSGQPAEQGKASKWLTSDPFKDRKYFSSGIAWSKLAGFLRAIDAQLGGFDQAIIDHPGLTGCLVRVAPGNSKTPARHEDWDNLLDPDASLRKALDCSRSWLQGVRSQLDPDGLINPHAWPPPWPGGEC